MTVKDSKPEQCEEALVQCRQCMEKPYPCWLTCINNTTETLCHGQSNSTGVAVADINFNYSARFRGFTISARSFVEEEEDIVGYGESMLCV